MNFVGSHIISVDQFDAPPLIAFSRFDKMQPYAMRQRITRVLQGAILSNMFFEPSTRTRVSFGSAFNLLGGEVRETTEAASSSLAKGESLYDTARVLSGYSDVIVMRHPDSGSVAKFAEASRVLASDKWRRRPQRTPQSGAAGSVHHAHRNRGARSIH